MKLSSSNPNKIREFREILGDSIEIVEGQDLKEVAGNARDVILYKSLDAGAGYIVEDTIVTIDGKEVVDIRWNIEGLKDYIGKKIEFIVHIGHNTGKQIHIYKGMISGVISEPKGESGFGFDPFFLPDGSDLTLAELSNMGEKHVYSARRIALENLIHTQQEEKININNISEWKGEYQ